MKRTILVTILFVMASLIGLSQYRQEIKNEVKAVETKTADKIEEGQLNTAPEVSQTASPEKETPPEREFNITPIPTVKPTITVISTPTIAPTPYLKHSNPKDEIQKRENEICEIFGEKDCGQAISWTRAKNYTLSPLYYNGVPKRWIGMIPIDCGMPQVQQYYSVNSLEECQQKAYIPSENLKAAQRLLAKEGWVGFRRALGYL